MGERFYLAQLAAIGTCPGKPNKRRKRVAWDDDKKAQAVELYQAGNPTPENTMEIVEQIAKELEESINGVRMILSKANVYIKKDGGKPAASSGSGEGSKRVSKAAAVEGLVAALESAGVEVDEDIIGKLTGKAAVYFTEVLAKLQ